MKNQPITIDQLRKELKNLATKAELKNLATKAELKNLATKVELKNLATKAELKNLTTKAELKNLADRMDEKFADQEEKMDTRFKYFKEDVIHEMLDIKDVIMSELKANREEQTILSSQHDRILTLEDKMDKLESIHPQGQHQTI